jgi:hypothetical protein
VHFRRAMELGVKCLTGRVGSGVSWADLGRSIGGAIDVGVDTGAVLLLGLTVDKRMVRRSNIAFGRRSKNLLDGRNRSG